MRVDLRAILMVLAIVCLVLSAFGVAGWRGDKVNLMAAGLAFWALAVLVG